MADRPPNDLPRIPELEGDYELVRELGRGGTAVVYLARDRDLGRDVAIKLIRPSHLQDEDAVARLVREARTVGKLQHPNIVMLLGTRRLGSGGLALILQYVPGRTLKKRIRDEGPLPFDHVERILRDLGNALAYAHRRRIVHRDIKPENVYLDDDAGVARLADFGIARAWDSDSGLTLPGTAIGTPTYMSPEQVDGGDLDGRSDLYGLGLLAWEMLTGRQPWAGESLYSVIYKQKHEALPDLAELRPDTPGNLRRAVAGALRKERSRRWGSAEEFLAALARGSAFSPSTPGGPPDYFDWEKGDPGAVLEEIESARTVQFRPSELAATGGGEGTPPREADHGASAHPDAPPFPSPSSGLSRIAERRRRRKRLGRAAVLFTLLLVVGGGGAALVFGTPEGEEVRSLLAQILPVNGPPESAEAGGEPYGTWQPSDVDPGPGGGGPETDPDPLPPPAGGADDEELPGDEELAEATDGVEIPEGARLSVVQGGGQEAPAGRRFDEPVLLRVEGEDGTALEGIPVVLQVVAGGGSVSPGRAITGADGVVRAVWTVGGAGTDQALAVAFEGSSQIAEILTARATPREPAALRPGAGGGQAGEVGQTLADPIEVVLVDEAGQGVPGREVRFEVTAGGGSIEPQSAETDGSGVARARWTLGRTEGVQEAAARIDGLTATFTAETTPPRIPVRSSVVAGGTHTCRLDGGGLVCWGDNARGQLGDGSGAGRSTPGGGVPGGPWAQVATGLSHTCALDVFGTAHCWGDNDAGQLGDGSTTRRAAPTPVADAPPFVEIRAGMSHTCARTRDDAVYCWGQNVRGQLGDGSTSTRSTPTRVDSSNSFRALALGWHHTCALDTGGTVHCWGTNTTGELGRSTLDRFPTPARVAGGHTFVQISAGNAHTCGLTAGGGVVCWGANDHGQLGDGSTETRRLPQAVTSEQSFTAVAAGAVHTCALAESGTAYCWGRNVYGQVGDGTTTGRSTPVEVDGAFRFDRIHAFGSHTCGRTPGGDLLCWGYNAEGQLGDGTRQNRSSPVDVGGGSD